MPNSSSLRNAKCASHQWQHAGWRYHCLVVACLCWWWPLGTIVRQQEGHPWVGVWCTGGLWERAPGTRFPVKGRKMCHNSFALPQTVAVSNSLGIQRNESYQIRDTLVRWNQTPWVYRLWHTGSMHTLRILLLEGFVEIGMSSEEWWDRGSGRGAAGARSWAISERNTKKRVKIQAVIISNKVEPYWKHAQW